MMKIAWRFYNRTQRMEKVGVWKKRAQRNDRNRWNKWQIIKINECDLFGSIVPFFFDARHRWCAVFWCVVYLRDLVIAIVIHTINTFQYDFRRSVGVPLTVSFLLQYNCWSSPLRKIYVLLWCRSIFRSLYMWRHTIHNTNARVNLGNGRRCVSPFLP